MKTSIEIKLKEWSLTHGIKEHAYSVIKDIVAGMVEDLAKENEELRMENAMMYNRLRVINRAATNYTVEYDNDGKAITRSEFKKQWDKPASTKAKAADLPHSTP